MANETYWDYLALDRLLACQDGLEQQGDVELDDELHFIIVHQAYELWFKLALRSLRKAIAHMGAQRVAESEVPHVVDHLRRITSILRLAVDQFEVMETMTPQGFLAFRTKLVPSSGFQSFQMRELEILLGLEDAQRVLVDNIDPLAHIQELAKDSPAGALAWGRICQARSEDTLLGTLNDWLYRTPIQGSTPDQADDEQQVEAFIESYLVHLQAGYGEQLESLLGKLAVSDREKLESKFSTLHDLAKGFLLGEDVDESERRHTSRVRAAILFIESYRQLPLLAWPRLLLDLVVELEQQLVLWRHRHARMVERIIGRRPGTGGSGGVDYLDKTGRYRVFRNLWAIRTVLLPDSQLPPLQNPGIYGFAERS